MVLFNFTDITNYLKYAILKCFSDALVVLFIIQTKSLEKLLYYISAIYTKHI